jgi:hypothetical protein
MDKRSTGVGLQTLFILFANRGVKTSTAQRLGLR